MREKAMITVNTYEAKTRLSELLRIVNEKKEVVRICRKGKTMAELVWPGRSKSRNNPLKRHLQIMGVKIKCDLTKPSIDENDLPDYMR
jgi:antitoxin (DNA-binding transcriptional repressor) of toxin-antitoxin stability system